MKLGIGNQYTLRKNRFNFGDDPDIRTDIRFPNFRNIERIRIKLYKHVKKVILKCLCEFEPDPVIRPDIRFTVLMNGFARNLVSICIL